MSQERGVENPFLLHSWRADRLHPDAGHTVIQFTVDPRESRPRPKSAPTCVVLPALHAPSGRRLSPARLRRRWLPLLPSRSAPGVTVSIPGLVAPFSPRLTHLLRAASLSPTCGDGTGRQTRDGGPQRGQSPGSS